MGKIGRTKRANSRKLMKKRAKDAKRTLYAQYAAEGRNKGSKRARTQGRKGPTNANKHAHIMGNCGNAGCYRCNPTLYNLPPSDRLAALARRLGYTTDEAKVA